MSRSAAPAASTAPQSTIPAPAKAPTGEGVERLSLRAAIDAKCKSCIYDPGAPGLGGWREQVRDCGGVNCPLYPVRPTPRQRVK